MAPLNILIVGCGIAGSTLASFLLLSEGMPAHEKPQITILERAPGMRSQGQNIDVRGAGITIIRKLGLEGAVRASTTGEVGVQWVDDKGAIWASIGADRTGKLSTPTADIEILRGRLAELCWLRSKDISESVQAQGGKGIDFIFGDYLDHIEQDNDQVHVRFAKSRREMRYDLVVGADGLQSQVRRLVWGASGEEDRVKKLGAYGAFFSIPRIASDTLHRQWFHASGRRNIMLRPDQQNKRTTAFIFIVNEEDARLREAAMKGREGLESQKDIMQEYFSDAGWQSDRVLSEMRKTQDFYYDMIAQVKLDHYSKGRVVLLGDAG
jgi:2-polyprenyl-6-methoxyphenol hydroxylase-like FAD-dependent oxidoreductase